MVKKSYEDFIEPRLAEIEQWAKNGLTEQQIYDNIGMKRTTFYRLKQAYPQLANILKFAKAKAVVDVENALFKSAVGHNTEEVVEEYDGNGELRARKVTKKKVPPNTTAMIFYLSNRASDQWRAKQESNVNLNTSNEVVKEIKSLSEKITNEDS